ncbi:MAG: hypothetical protein OEV30_11460 [Ignavibacteria bacterium]|nr:hypothetical protein [Ignavibacteria bacterium]
MNSDTRMISSVPQILFRCSAVLFLCLLLLVSSYDSHAQLVNGRLVSSLYTWEQFDTVDVSRSYARGMQSLLLDVSEGSLSLHTHLQVAGTLKKTLDEEADFRSYYMYLKVRDIAGVVDISFGRLPYFAGVGNGTLDGALATLRFAENRVRLTAYGGARTPQELTLNGWGSLDKNFVTGGQILALFDQARVGLSYVNRQRERAPYWTLRADSLLNPVETFITPDALKEQFLSLDATYQLSSIRLYGRYDYDLFGSQTQRGQLGVSYQLTGRLSLSGDFVHRAPRVAYNSFFALFAASSVNEYQLGGDYRLDPSWRVFLRGAFVDYTDDESIRYSVGIAHTYAGISYRGSTGYAGEQNFVSVYGAYPLFERKVIPTASVTFGSYKLSDTASRDDAMAVALGATIRPIQVISFDLQAQAISNKIVDQDFRFFGKFTYWFSETLSLFE